MNHISRRAFLHTLPLMTRAAAQSRRPNVLFLFSDDQRFDTIRALGNHEIETPNLDRLVKRGVSFTHASIMGGTVGAVCIPSRAMMLSGRTLFHAHDALIAEKPAEGRKALPIDFWPELLKRSGYATFATGKWHNRPAHFNRCFDDGDNVFFGGMSDQLKTPVSHYDPSGRYPKEQYRIGEAFSTELFADTAIRFLQGRRNKPESFVLYTAFTSPHDPRMAPKKYADMYSAAKVKLPENFLPQHPFDNGELRVRDELLAPFPRTPEVIREHIAAYYAMVTHLDAQIGRILKALEDSGHADNTLIVFAGDNGLALGRHGLMGKQNVYDHSVRVPLILSGPGVPRDRRSDRLCYLLDLAPTLVEAAGLPAPNTFEGESLWPAIKGGKGGRDSLFFAYRNVQRAVRTRTHKFIRYRVNEHDTFQLFAVANDPHETTDLAGRPASKNLVQALSAELARWMKQTDDPLADVWSHTA